jgi:polysaccharide export outer membrane protein
MRPTSVVLRLLCLVACGAALAQTPAGSQPSGFASREPRYKLQPNDVIEIQFRYTPEFNFGATVQPDGFVSSQITGDIRVGGLTLGEAKEAIAKKASTRLKDPEVGILLKDFVKPHFVVAGEVAHPGTFELRGEVGLIQAIAMSGGFVRESAKRTQVILVRKTNKEFAEVKVFDLRKLMSPSNIREDVVLQPDDMVVVPRNTVSKFEPYLHISSIGAYLVGLGVL